MCVCVCVCVCVYVCVCVCVCVCVRVCIGWVWVQNTCELNMGDLPSHIEGSKFSDVKIIYQSNYTLS